MCGIYGVIGSENAYEEIKEGLERVSYRGYDSAGIATLGTDFFIEKVKGHPENLPDLKNQHKLGIGHDRWSTHSPPTKENAHPYLSNDKKIALVHNGIIENYSDVKNFLEDNGFIFYSETDTEVLPNLIQYYLDRKFSIQKAILKMATDIEGAYAIAFLHKEYPDKIFVIRYGSPICIGKNKNKYYISSDIASLPASVQEVIALDNEKFAIIEKNKVKIKTFKGGYQKTKWEKISKDSNTYKLGKYNSYLEKEIKEQPYYLNNVIRGRIIENPPEIKLAGIKEKFNKIVEADEIIFTGCGSALHSAQIAAHAMESIAKIKSRAINAGELQYFNPVITPKTVLIPVSQSGETADTIGCIDFYKSKGATVLGVVNVVNSTISRMVDAGIYIRAGQEISVASTKAVSNQILNLLMIVYLAGYKKGLSKIKYLSFISEIKKISKILNIIISNEEAYQEISEKYSKSSSMLCIGRGPLEIIAKETALKIKEISYIHAEGYSAAELKHGPLALVSPDTPTIAFVQSGLLGDKIISNIQEIKSRFGPVIIFASEEQYYKVSKDSNMVIKIPEINDKYLNLLFYLVAGQKLAYHIAEALGRPLDRPRSLAKAVSVE